MMYVYVIGWHPALEYAAHSGFEWRYSRLEALRFMASLVTLEAANDGPQHNLVFARLRVPFEVNPARPREYDDREHEITRWLDENRGLFELPFQSPIR